MAIVWIDSLSELQQLSRIYPAGGLVAVGASNVAGRDGMANGACQFSSGAANVTVTLPTPVALVVVGVAVKMASVVVGYRLPELRADSGAVSHLDVRCDGSGHLTLTRAGTLLATSTQVWTDLAGWHYVELKATVADSGGTGKVLVDGVTWIDFTGDTRNGGVSTSIDTVALVGGASGSITFDDLYVFDGTGSAPYNSFFGDCQVRRLFPNGDGAASAWTPSAGTTHNTLVKENPANTTDYVSSNTAGQRDLYTLDDLTQVTGTVHAVQAFVTATKTDSGARNVKVLTRGAAGAVSASPSLALPSAAYAQMAGQLATTDPDGNPWTIGRVNAMQSGAECV